MVQKRDYLELEIILVLLKGENYLRSIAKQLGESHSTILRKLNRLTTENVLDYKMEGKNKVFSIKKNLQAKNYIFNAERYKLIKLLRKYPKLDVIMDDVSRATKETLIVIFGSYAKFVAKEDSDIDVYVETRNRDVKEQVESIHSRIKVKFGDFDLSSNLIKEIIKNHVILKGVEEFYEKTKFFE
jgi:predicted nucleotidyltransferase